MCDIEYHKKLRAVIDPVALAEFNRNYIEVENTPQKKKECAKLDIETEEVQDKLRLSFSSKKILVFKSISDFLIINSITDSSNLLVIDDNDSYSFIEGKTYVNFQLQPGIFLFTNHQAYLGFLKFLKERDKGPDDEFCFVDAYNKDIRKIYLLTLSDKGRVVITYDLHAPDFDHTKDIRPGLDKFYACFSGGNKNLPKFLKSALVEAACGYPSATRLKMIVDNMSEITDRANKNFDVYLNNLSVDRIRADYDEVKTKYFDNLSGILSNLSQKIIGLPIAISATLLAVLTVKDESWILCLLIAAIIVTSVYVSLLLRVHFKDLQEIKHTFLADYKKLTENGFFIKHSEEKKTFEDIRARFDDRVRFMKIVIESYYWVMNIANIIIIVFTLNRLEVPQAALYITSIVCVTFLICFRNYIIREAA